MQELPDVQGRAPNAANTHLLYPPQYVDNGWVDPDADPVAQFKRFFKLGGKKEGEKGGDGKGKGK